MIQIYVTGGTFDKEYDYITGKLYFRDTHLQDMLETGRCTLDVDLKTLMMIDSLDMTEVERTNIIYNCRHCPHDNILITHGTDTMVETAEALHGANIEGKTIVLFGAMIPYAFGNSSDGFFNLGAALAFAQCNPPGVYIAMNGRCHDWDGVRKNKKTGFFEEV